MKKKLCHLFPCSVFSSQVLPRTREKTGNFKGGLNTAASKLSTPSSSMTGFRESMAYPVQGAFHTITALSSHITKPRARCVDSWSYPLQANARREPPRSPPHCTSLRQSTSRPALSSEIASGQRRRFKDCSHNPTIPDDAGH